MSFNGRDNRQGRNRDQQSGKFGLGPSGMCICPKCGNKIPHQRSTPCIQLECPKCGSKMFREKDPSFYTTS
ncbi:MAG: hypothetical protein ACTSO3_15620 [Candidatus Heimdallarchaeaceae archaeon]